MGYDRGDSFPYDFEPNRYPFGSKSKGKCHHDHIPFNMKRNGNIVFSVHQPEAKNLAPAAWETCVSWHNGDPTNGPPLNSSIQ